MSKRRVERMSVEIRRVISRIIHEDIKDPRIDFSTVSVSRVDVANDISHARVNFSILGDEAKQEETMQALQKARGYIRSEVAREIQIKHAPELEFRLDKSIEHGVRISALLNEIKESEPKSE
ncbi:MAG: 30S ribosome-binding factor RbfA [Syntrophomonadaceae bacterium]|nr:30S ribosome-binding factor RbfA [Syntrophomonadaceae bacterium]